MDLNELTVEDCVENYYRKGEIVILENGQVIGFRKEKEFNHGETNSKCTD